MTTTLTHRHLDAEVEAELDHIRDLVLVRDVLAARGATREELREYDGVIAEAREQLAASTRRALAA